MTNSKTKSYLYWINHFMKKGFRVSILTIFFMRKWPKYANYFFYGGVLLEITLIVLCLNFLANWSEMAEALKPRCVIPQLNNMPLEEYLSMGIDFVNNTNTS